LNMFAVNRLYPHPSLPPARGKERDSAAFRRRTVLSAPLRGSSNRPVVAAAGYAGDIKFGIVK
jgi:hypothetical protein